LARVVFWKRLSIVVGKEVMKDGCEKKREAENEQWICAAIGDRDLGIRWMSKEVRFFFL
jgi:hypothetical protein